ncbi:MAG: N-6 DNA methylase [Ignavibacteriaceae bacterium]|nr:N-6 DNA methylase [Ignavibacteriaceae bacterium]
MLTILSPFHRISERLNFFVEAKKPSHGLENKDFYFQTARYGWNASTPLAVLTDFEEFHIIDCRFRPNIDDALNYKLKKFHYTDYANEEKFSEIYWLFSREAVANNSIEKYSDELPKPRGKKAKGLKTVTQTIDDSFLEELDEIRNDLAKSFKKNNNHLSSEELTEATQRTIDRLVFIKFLEDKLIEPDHYVSEFGGRKKAWEDFLIDSRKLDAKYNGVVFKKSIIDSKSIIEPDDKTFSAICEELSHENTPYNFDAIPIHILGSIYERFLGKVVNATDKRVTIEEKPEVRKAGGVYYTPQYIVKYIVDNTVGKLIENKSPKEIAKMRFADIACGSGSFLITVFERLLDYHKRWYINNSEQAKKDGCILIEGTYRLSLKQKTKILLNNVYGVDIDQQAVEVTQLSLYLKLLEDETTATANDSWVMFKEQLLPDLNKNIVCGNSLIGTDILTQQTSLPFVKGGTEGGLDELKLKPMDFETVFPHIFPSKAGGLVRRSPKDEDGFDAIVGNPPYGAELSDAEKNI